jgi:hypothetical protein
MYRKGELIMQVMLERISQLIQQLKDEATSLVNEVRELLKSLRLQRQNPGDGQKEKVRPLWLYLRERPGYDTVSIVWTQVIYYNKARNMPHYRDIARGRGYQISQTRFLRFARAYHPEIQQELWAYEKTFAAIRYRQSLLSKARTALIQFKKMAAKPTMED